MRGCGPLVLGRWAPEPGRALLPCPGLEWLERAAHLLQVQRDFSGALAACERGLEWLGPEPGEPGSTARAADIRCSLCAMGLQALAEQRQWRQAWDWLLQQYGSPDRVPARLLQMCIILYSKAGEPGRIQQAVCSWLKGRASTGAPGSVGLVLELYILHVLLPLGLYAEAEKEIQDTTVLTEQQKESARQVVLQRRSKVPEQQSVDGRSQVPAECSKRRHSAHYTTRHMFKFIQQVLGLCRRSLRLVSLRKLLLAVFVAYLLIIRLDPASPATLSCLTSLRHFLRSAWYTMFSPYYKARVGM
ncbi:peroxisome assembly protein 26 [Pristis pectinata]|uniref:peroxisome assembly protein 26 n=1 Tax=Pristis pectinata TaxID=685728 RepID=UPI00223CB815|nr:peroxisome assembly protein 26 [Pristis pectinata]